MDLIKAAEKGDTEAIKALLAARNINVNHVNVSLYPLSPSSLVVGDRGDAHLPDLISHSNPRNRDLSSPNA